ncbi:MAG: hypothetical protein DIU71_09595, partial [Proteobacteria bacterium]
MSSGKTSFSVFLLRPAAQQEVYEKLFRDGIPLGEGLDGKFVVLPTSRQWPRWYTALRPLLSRDPPELFSESPAGMLFVRRGVHAFVVTFGHAWQQLRLHWVELDFGRRVALNSVPPDKVLEVSTEQVFAKWHLAKERSPKATSVREFALEHDRDLVAALEGVPSEPAFGGTLRGSTSLRMSIPLLDIGKALDRAAALFQSDAYKAAWPEIDNIQPLANEQLSSELDQLLDRDLKSGAAASSAVLFTPYFRKGDVTSTDSYVIGRLSKNPVKAPYLLFGSWESYLKGRGKKPSLDAARDTPVHMFDAAGDKIERRSLYECLGYELSIDGRQYVLSSGIWYEAENDFVSKVNKAINRIPSPSVRLPTWDRVMSEGEYNRYCCRDGAKLHFDARNLYFGGGKSQFEFCDFLHPRENYLFFAKIPSRSSDCSHLVEQVRRTVELLFSVDDSFRKELKKTMKKHYPRAARGWLDRRPVPGQWKFCLVSLGKDKAELPF